MSSARRAWDSLGVHGRVALLAASAAVIAIGVSSRKLIWAGVTPVAKPAAAGGAEQQRALQYASAVDTFVKQVDGRSLFFVPSAPPPPRPPPVAVADSQPKPPAPPSTYGGPSIIGMLNDSVWFSDGSKLKTGEASDTVKVVRLDSPWGAVLEWKGVEFTVGLFERDRIVMPAPAPKPVEAAPGGATPEPDSTSRLTAKDPLTPGAAAPAEPRKE
jgi:hypothetical protein